VEGALLVDAGLVQPRARDRTFTTLIDVCQEDEDEEEEE